MNVYVVASHYQSGVSMWVKSTLDEAVAWVFDLIKQETEDQINLIKGEGEDLPIEEALKEMRYEDAVNLYSEMTSSDEFENRITITLCPVGSHDSGYEINPNQILNLGETFAINLTADTLS